MCAGEIFTLPWPSSILTAVALVQSGPRTTAKADLNIQVSAAYLSIPICQACNLQVLKYVSVQDDVELRLERK